MTATRRLAIATPPRCVAAGVMNAVTQGGIRDPRGHRRRRARLHRPHRGSQHHRRAQRLDIGRPADYLEAALRHTKKAATATHLAFQQLARSFHAYRNTRSSSSSATRSPASRARFQTSPLRPACPRLSSGNSPMRHALSSEANANKRDANASCHKPSCGSSVLRPRTVRAWRTTRSCSLIDPTSRHRTSQNSINSCGSTGVP